MEQKTWAKKVTFEKSFEEPPKERPNVMLQAILEMMKKDRELKHQKQKQKQKNKKSKKSKQKS